MNDLKQRVQRFDPNLKALNLNEISAKANGNIYEALAVMAKRANQLTVELKEELQHKLEEFAVHYDTIEEILENTEQLEISRFYEKLPNPALIAMYEFMQDKLGYEYRNFDKDSID